MYGYNENELVDGISTHLRREGIWPWFWFRDAVMDAQRRGLVEIKTGTNPFWCERDLVELTARGRQVLEAVQARSRG